MFCFSRFKEILLSFLLKAFSNLVINICELKKKRSESLGPAHTQRKGIIQRYEDQKVRPSSRLPPYRKCAMLCVRDSEWTQLLPCARGERPGHG